MMMLLNEAVTRAQKDGRQVTCCNGGENSRNEARHGLIRDILLSFDETQAARVNKKNLQIEGYTQEQIDFHIEIMEEAGLLYHEIVRPTRDGHVVGGMRIDMGIRPTMAGYDFAHSVRDNEVWKETKKGAKSAGGFTLDLLRDLAKGFIKTKIEVHTGVKL